ncbi:MAG: TIR domain-containing protein [Blastocatellia bacterium]
MAAKKSGKEKAGTKTRKRRLDAFLSHSSKDKPVASRLVDDSEAAGFSVWFDRDNLRGGDPLIQELQDALSKSKSLILLWSKAASKSEWVDAEWQAAYYLKKRIVPCLLDGTPLRPFLLRFISCDFRESYDTGAAKLLEALGKSAGRGVKLGKPRQVSTPPEAEKSLVEDIASMQHNVTTALQYGQMDIAASIQQRLDPVMTAAMKEYPRDSWIHNLMGYQKKNEYLIRHWDEIQERKSPKDEAIDEAAKHFYAALSIQPEDPSAMNGLGSVLILRGELDTAEFYVRHALALAKAKGMDYAAAEHDLQLIARLKQEQAKE